MTRRKMLNRFFQAWRMYIWSDDYNGLKMVCVSFFVLIYIFYNRSILQPSTSKMVTGSKLDLLVVLSTSWFF